MKKTKLTLNLSMDLKTLLESRIPKGQRNKFIEEAIRSKFVAMDQETFMKDFTQHNRIQHLGLAHIDAGMQLEGILEEDEYLSDTELSEFDDLL